MFQRVAEFFSFPASVAQEFKLIPWFHLLVYLPLFFEPWSLGNLLIVAACHTVVLICSFRAYWCENRQVMFLVTISLAAAIISGFYSQASIVLFAFTTFVAAAHRVFSVRNYFVVIITLCFLLVAWHQVYSVLALSVGVFFTLINGVSISYQVRALYRQLSQNLEKEEVRTLATYKERERIAQDLHDFLGQNLTAINLKASLARRLVASSPETVEQQLDEIVDLAKKTLMEVRDTVNQFRDSNVAQEIADAKLAFGAADICFSFPQHIPPLSAKLEQALAWVIREGTTNVMRHANATECELDLELLQNRLVLTIRDNGTGLPVKDKLRWGNGLNSIRQRCDKMGATLRLENDKGCVLQVTVKDI